MEEFRLVQRLGERAVTFPNVKTYPNATILLRDHLYIYIYASSLAKPDAYSRATDRNAFQHRTYAAHLAK